MKPERGSQSGYHPVDQETLSRNKLCTAGYKGNMKNGSGGGVVAYRVFPGKQMVIYSGLNDGGLSTINGTDRILTSLREEDSSIDPDKYRFFDIQTKRGYDYMFEGKFYITEIKFHKNGEETLIPRIELSQLSEEVLPILKILTNP